MLRQWQRNRFRILTQAQLLQEVDGITMGEAPDIGLHMSGYQSIDVTHIPTGKRIGGFRTLGAALEFAHRVAHLRPWNDASRPLTPAEETAIRDLDTAIRRTEP